METNFRERERRDGHYDGVYRDIWCKRQRGQKIYDTLGCETGEKSLSLGPYFIKAKDVNLPNNNTTYEYSFLSQNTKISLKFFGNCVEVDVTEGKNECTVGGGKGSEIWFSMNKYQDVYTIRMGIGECGRPTYLAQDVGLDEVNKFYNFISQFFQKK